MLRILLQEIFVLEDCFYYNDGTSVNGLIIDSGCSCTSNGSYITITTSTSGEKSVWLPTTLSKDSDWCIQFNVEKQGVVQTLANAVMYGTNSYYGCSLNTSNQMYASNFWSNYKSVSFSNNSIMEWNYVNKVLAIKWNGASQGTKSNPFSTDVQCRLYTNQGRTQYIRSIKVKAL